MVRIIGLYYFHFFLFLCQYGKRLAGSASCSGIDPVYIKATTMTLAAIVFSQIGAVFNCRTEKQSVFKVGLFSNKQVNFGIIFEVALIIALVYLPPLQSVFHTLGLDSSDWLLLCVWPPLILLIEEVRKAWSYRKMPRTIKNNRGVNGMKVIVVGLGRMGIGLSLDLVKKVIR